MTWTTCCRCKEPFMLHPETEAALRRSSQTFHCPWGHPQHFSLGPSEAEVLRRERDRLKQRTAQLEDEVGQAHVEVEAERRRAAAARGQVTKIKKRISGGACPCCNRTFSDLQRHMATKHASFLAEEVQAEAGRPLQ